MRINVIVMLFRGNRWTWVLGQDFVALSRSLTIHYRVLSYNEHMNDNLIGNIECIVLINLLVVLFDRTLRIGM